MLVRLSKIVLVATVSFFFFLLVFNNLTDYNSNYQFVKHVLSMDTTFENNAGMWRALDSTVIHHVFYWLIIVWQLVVMVLCGWGALILFQARHQSAALFQRAKSIAVTGITLNLLLWFIAFIAIGGEWFLMWQSKTWNGHGSAFRLFGITGIIMLFLMQPEMELEEDEG